MKIAKHLKSIGARLFGNNQQPAANEPVAKPSIVHIGDRGQPVRVPLTSFQPVVAERRKIPTGTIKAEADKLKFIEMLNSDNMGRGFFIHGASNTAGMEQIYGDDLAKAMSSNIQAKVVIRAGGDGK